MPVYYLKIIERNLSSKLMVFPVLQKEYSKRLWFHTSKASTKLLIPLE